ncbi:MAG: hypothetical protein H6620_10680 [Halobacteriovoraceae bacterium]|nr:hypothetical protein [Halobacteriovoraceae bacterium]
MKSEIKSILAESENFDKSFHPEDIHNFNFLLRILIGPSGENVQESFDIEVCSTKWIEENLSDDEVMIGRHTLIMKEYNFISLRKRILKLFAAKTGGSWKEIATYFSRYGHWEFEDYKN